MFPGADKDNGVLLLELDCGVHLLNKLSICSYM